MTKITIIGTSHISPLSLKKVTDTIEKEKPDCVAIELDPKRYYALKQGQSKVSLGMGLTIWFFSWLQKKLAEKTGIMPGSEMLAAIDSARKVNARIVLIDMDILDVIEKLRRISFIVKLKLFFKIFIGFFSFKRVKFDLKKVPEEKIIKETLKYLNKEFPELYKILVRDRNIYMAKWVKKLSRDYKKIIVVVGAGHKIGLKKLLKIR